MVPGETTFTRMLRGANFEARPRAMPISPIFAADKCVRPLPLAEIEPSSTKNRIRPERFSSIRSFPKTQSYRPSALSRKTNDPGGNGLRPGNHTDHIIPLTCGLAEGEHWNRHSHCASDHL